nr:GreA/GreB family elongation factor [Pseudomonas brassicacearum subsp. brassicacearum]
MSRAFVNEDNAAAQADQPVERQVSAQPNYVTPTGLAQLQARVAELQALHAQQASRGELADKQRIADLERDLRYFTQRLQSAQVVAPTSSDQVRIGHWVTFVDEQDHEQRVQLVGEDQADAASGLINWGSPLGRALLGGQRLAMR